MFEVKDGKKRYLCGRDDPAAAERAALACGGFRRDDEEECFYAEPVSCYNCRYRRWTADSFDCMKGEGMR